MKQQRRGGDGVACEDHLLEPRGAHPGDEPPGDRLRPTHRAIDARRDPGPADGVADPVLRHLGRLAEGVPGVQRRHVRLRDLRLPGEFLFEPFDGDVAIAPVHPEHQPQRPHVATAVCFPRVQPEVLDGVECALRDVELQHLVGRE